MRYLGFDSFDKVDRMTYYEYELRMKAANLKMIDEERKIYLQAWANREVKSERKKGKGSELVYKDFNDFYDYERKIEEVLGLRTRPESAKTKTSKTSTRYMEYLERRKNGKL